MYLGTTSRNTKILKATIVDQMYPFSPGIVKSDSMPTCADYAGVEIMFMQIGVVIGFLV